MGTDFDYKRVNDPIHGIIGLSKIECDIVQSATFRRLSHLQQLGLSYFVFPGATHTRFSHSIGTMHVLFQMIDSINNRLKKENGNPAIGDPREIQKLRLAALLHDIGHYPLGHSSEWVFYRNESEKSLPEFEEDEADEEFASLNRMADVQKVTKVSHESFGKLILTHCSDIGSILKKASYDPKEIMATFCNQAPKRTIYSQLIHSTLDADRLDFLLRDSYYAGISYGHVDLAFILSNLRFDENTDLFAIDYKGISSLEHFLISRYFVYHNMTYHKKVMGYELIAKELYYAMGKEGKVIAKFEELEDELKTNCSEFLTNFDDNYFWNNIRNWKPKGEHKSYYEQLRMYLLARKKPHVICEERRLIRCEEDVDAKFGTLRKNFLSNNKLFEELCVKFKVDKSCFVIYENKIGFEEQPPLTYHDVKTSDSKRNELGRVYEGYTYKDLLKVEFSIIRELSKFSQYIRRLYFFDLYDIKPDIKCLRDELISK